MSILNQYRTKLLIDIIATSGTYRFADDVVYDNSSNEYSRGLLNEAEIKKTLPDESWGVSVPQEIKIDLSFTSVLSTAELRNAPVKIWSYEPGDSTVKEFLAYGKISEFNVLDKMEITVSPQESEWDDKILPLRSYQQTDWSETSGINPPYDLGKAYNIIIGQAHRVPLIYVHKDTTRTEYDYIIGYGPIADSTITVYRNEVLVSSAEYVLYTATSTAHKYYPFAHLKFSAEQLDFSGNPYALHANVMGLTMTSTSPERNPVRVIQYLLSSTRYGLGLTVDTTAFNQASTVVTTQIASTYFVDGFISNQSKAIGVFNELLFICRGRLDYNSTGGIAITIDVNDATTAAHFGFGDGVYENIVEVSENKKTPVRDTIKSIYLNYGWNEWTQKYEFQGKRENMFSFGKDKVINIALLRDHETVDRVLSYYNNVYVYGDTKRTITVGKEARGLSEGKIINIECPRYSITGRHQVRSIAKKNNLNTYELECITHNSSIYTYSTGVVQSSANDDALNDFSVTIPNPPTGFQILSSSLRIDPKGGFKSVSQIVVATMPSINAQYVRFGYKTTADTAYNFVDGKETATANEFKAVLLNLNQYTTYNYIAETVNAYNAISTTINSSNSTSKGTTWDATAPGTVVNLTISAPGGKIISLDWNDVDPSTILDFSEYGIYRNENSSDMTASTKIAEVKASRFIDASSDLSYASTYYYAVSIFDGSENEGAKSTVEAKATPLEIDSNIASINLINNPSFENGFNAWMAEGAVGYATNATVSTVYKTDGEMALLLKGGTWVVAESQAFPLSPAENYIVKCKIYSPVDSTGFYIRMNESETLTTSGFIAAGDSTHVTNINSVSTLSSGWNTIELIYTGYTSAYYGSLMIGNNNTSTSIPYYVDAVELRKKLNISDMSSAVPLAPSSFAKSTVGVYQTSDGNTKAWISFVWGNPSSNWAYTNLLYKRSSHASYQIAEQTTSTAGMVDDLTPGLSYDFALQGFSPFGYPGTYATYTTVAVGDTIAPPAIVNLTGTGKFQTWSFNWTPSTVDDLWGYHFQIADSSAFSTVLYDNMSSVDQSPYLGNRFDYTNGSISVGTLYSRVKGVDYSGNQSTVWSSISSANSTLVVSTDIGNSAVSANHVQFFSIGANKLTIGNGVNIMPARYTDFEEDSLPNIGVANGNLILDTSTWYFGKQSIKLTSTAAGGVAVLSSGGSSYNISISPGRVYLMSAYVKSNVANSTGQFLALTSNSETPNANFITGTSGVWARYWGVLDFTASTVKRCWVRVGIVSSGVIMNFDGIMLEEIGGTSTTITPSAYSLPGQTVISGDQIETGVLKIVDGSVCYSAFGGDSSGTRDGQIHLYTTANVEIANFGKKTTASDYWVGYVDANAGSIYGGILAKGQSIGLFGRAEATAGGRTVNGIGGISMASSGAGVYGDGVYGAYFNGSRGNINFEPIGTTAKPTDTALNGTLRWNGEKLYINISAVSGTVWKEILTT